MVGGSTCLVVLVGRAREFVQEIRCPGTVLPNRVRLGMIDVLE